jgi:hypothetical protein
MDRTLNPSFRVLMTTWPLLLAPACGGCGGFSSPSDRGTAVAIADAGTTHVPSTAMLKPEDALVVLDGAQGHLGDCAVGIAGVTGTSFVAWAGNPSLSRHPLRKGDVLVCQDLFRVVEVGDVSAYAPGATRPGVVIDMRPRSIPGLRVQGGSIILNVAGKTEWRSTTFSNVQIGNGMGRFEIIDAAAPVNSGLRTVAVGDLIPLIDGSHRVLAVVAPDASAGVGGWIEISGQP